MTKMEELSKTVQEILGMSYKINIWAFYVNQDKHFSIRDTQTILNQSAHETQELFISRFTPINFCRLQ